MISQTHNLWVLVADASQARIIQISAGDAGAAKAPASRSARGEEQARLVNTHPEADRERPTRADAAGHTIQHADTEAERTRRFAKEITHWVTEQMDASLLGHLVVLAPSKMIGHFREMFPKEGLGSVALKEANLVYMSASEIANHPAVAEASQPAGTR